MEGLSDVNEWFLVGGGNDGGGLPVEYDELRAVLVRNTTPGSLSTRCGPQLNKRSAVAKLCPTRDVVDHRQLNNSIRNDLLQLGWEAEKKVHGQMAVDFHKNGVFVEVQFGKYAFAAENLHVKMPLIRHRYGCAASRMFVLVVPTIAACRRMCSGVASFESVLRNYVLPPVFGNRFEYPLAVVGVNF